MAAHNNKGAVIRALMQNPQLAGLISEAINSPVGSTKRRRAQKIVNILNRTSPSDRATSPEKERPKQDSEPRLSDWVVFPSPPTPAFGFDNRKGNNKPVFSDGRGGPRMAQLDLPGSPSLNLKTPFPQFGKEVGAAYGITNIPPTAKKGTGGKTPIVLAGETVDTPSPIKTNVPRGDFSQISEQQKKAYGNIPLDALESTQKKNPLAYSGYGSKANIKAPPIVETQAPTRSAEEEITVQPEKQGSLLPLNDFYSFVSSVPSLAVRNNNPGNLRYVGQENARQNETGFAEFNTPQDGVDALKRDLYGKITGNTATGLNKDSTLLDFAKVYAPEDDGNDPQQYAKNLAKILGVSENSTLGELVGRLDDFAFAISRIESPDFIEKNPEVFKNISPYLKNAVASNIGASGFALAALNNRDVLKSLPGFKNLPDEQLAFGADLSGQYNKLQEVLKKELNLDQKLAKMQSAQALADYYQTRGVSLVDDLNDYVRGKDQYLNEVQEMIDSFNYNLSNINISDPVIAQQSTAYLNYLNTLKGRQNQRYIDFVNQSINKYNADLQHAASMADAAAQDYANTLDFYERELKRRSDLKLQEFENMYNAVADMYNTVAEAPQKELERLKLIQNLNVARSKAVKDVVTNSVFNDFSKDYKTLKNINVLDDQGRLSEYIDDLSALISDTVQAEGGMDPYNIVRAINAAIPKTINLSPDGEPALPEEKIKEARRLMALAQKYVTEKLAEGDEEGAALGQQWYQTAKGALGQTLRDSFADPETFSILERAFKELVYGKSRFLGLGKKLPTREEFLGEYGSVINKDILASLYDTLNSEDFQNNEENKTMFSVPVTQPDGTQTFKTKRVEDLTPDELLWVVSDIAANAF